MPGLAYLAGLGELAARVSTQELRPGFGKGDDNWDLYQLKLIGNVGNSSAGLPISTTLLDLYPHDVPVLIGTVQTPGRKTVTSAAFPRGCW
jgi:hypothetical protein